MKISELQAMDGVLPHNNINLRQKISYVCPRRGLYQEEYQLMHYDLSRYLDDLYRL